MADISSYSPAQFARNVAQADEFRIFANRDARLFRQHKYGAHALLTVKQTLQIAGKYLVCECYRGGFRVY